MEIDESTLAMIRRTNPGDFAVYRVENGALQTLLSSPGLPALSEMTPEEYRRLTDKDAAAIVLEPDRPLVAAKLSEVLRCGDQAGAYPLTYRIRHRTRGMVWVRAKACLLGENAGAPVIIVSFAVVTASSEYAELLDEVSASVYVVDKRTHELLFVNRTAQQASGNRRYQNTQCFRYFNSLDAPCPWCSLPQMKDGRAHVDENYVPPTNKWFRHDVRDIDWYGREAAVFFVTNITGQKKREKQEEERFENLYRQIAAANPNAMAMFRLNLTKNTCTDAQSPYETARRQQESGTVDGYLAACAEIISDEKIRRECRARFTLPNLLREFQNGTTELSVEYPILSSAGNTIWIDGFITMTQNSESRDVEGIAYAINVTDRKVNDSILSRIAEERYDHIGLISPVSRSYEMWKKDGDYELSPHLRVNYDAVFGDIMKNYIFPEDQELFLDHGRIENIIARLDRDGEDSFVYRRHSDEGGVLYKQVKYVWLDQRRDLIMETQTDLTDLYRQQLEQVKRQHESELARERALSAESIPAGIGVIDAAGGELCLNYLNDGFYQMIGATRESYAAYEGRAIINAVLPEDRPGLSREVEAAVREKRQLRCRIRLLRGSGEYRWVEMVANHLPLNDLTERFYAAYYDVDELLRTQTELMEKELVFRDILTHSDLLHFIYFPDRARYETEILPSRLGNFPKAMDGYPDSFIRFVGLNEADAGAYRRMVRAIDAGAPEAECTVLMHYADKTGWYRVHMLSILDDGGNTVKAIGNVFNVDRTVEAERAITDERLRVESLRGVYLATACFNVTRDTEITFNEGGGLSRAVDTDGETLAEARRAEPDIDGQRPETLTTLLSAARQIPDEKQRREFIRCCSHAGMLRLFQEGRRDVVLEYRRRLGDALVWMSTRLILMAEPSTGDILAFYYTRDISMQKKTEQITKLTLEKSCDYVALLNVAKRTLKFWSISQTEAEYGGDWDVEAENDYDECTRSALGRYISDAGQVTGLLSVENLVANLTTSDEYSVTYDRNSPSGAVSRKQVQYRFLDDTRSEILVVQTDITAAYIKEQERTRQLQEALAAAEKANSAKTEFISRISHDIRTPISAITNMTAFAREDAGDREKLLHDLSRIEASNTFLLSLINDVLDISKIDSGKIELHPEPYPFDEYMESIRSIFEPLCLQNGQTFRILGGELAAGRGIVVDRIRYNQIALNLLSNAVKYTPRGGTITYVSQSRKLSGGKIGCGFEISDTGIGMSEQFQKTMFEPFTQEYDNPERLKLASGTGLGLSIVKRLVDLMGGTIQVKSAQGKGTSIRVGFVMPEATPEQLAAADGVGGGKPQGGELSGTVLLAEDNAINAEIAIRILGSLGLQIVHAENGRQAVEIFSASRPGQFCAVLMDIQMPVMNGYEASRAIRETARPDAGTVPIIAMTADAFEESVKKAKESGMNDYITKPVDTAKLYSVLRGRICL